MTSSATSRRKRLMGPTILLGGLALAAALSWQSLLFFGAGLYGWSMSAMGVQGYSAPAIVRDFSNPNVIGNRMFKTFSSPAIPIGIDIKRAVSELNRQGFQEVSPSPFILQYAANAPEGARYFDARWQTPACNLYATVELGTSEEGTVMSVRGATGEAGCL